MQVFAIDIETQVRKTVKYFWVKISRFYLESKPIFLYMTSELWNYHDFFFFFFRKLKEYVVYTILFLSVLMTYLITKKLAQTQNHNVFFTDVFKIWQGFIFTK